MKVFIFPGQGSQHRGMGKDLFLKYPELTAMASTILGYDIEELCLSDPRHLLNKTQFTQPALYVVNSLSYLHIIETQSCPQCVLGHSLGEFSALFAAGAFDFATGLKLVMKRGEIMGRINNGAMAALLGLTMSEVKNILNLYQLQTIDIANYNSFKQIVLSGTRQDIASAQLTFEDNGAKMYYPLNVSGAFHSRYMIGAAAEFGDYLREVTFSPLQMKVISNVTARPYQNEQISSLLQQQITSQVKWYESISLLMQNQSTFSEVGPGDVLSKMLGFIQSNPMEGLAAEDFEKSFSINAKSAQSKSSQPIDPSKLGSAAYRQDYNVKYAYVTGAMVHGIASKELVVTMGKAGMMGYFGTGGLKKDEIEQAIVYIQANLSDQQAYGMNLLNGTREKDAVSLFLKYNVRNIEAAAYMQVSTELVRLRLQGVSRNDDGSIYCPRRIMAKISRPEVATAFLSPPPQKIVGKLLIENLITASEAELAQYIAMADDLCVEADSGGHTDQGVAFTLLPTIIRQRDESMSLYGYSKKIRVGAAGGIGTPEAAAAAFILGADFILTGSINQCTVEAGMSAIVKDMLQDINVQDTEYAPAGDMFEIGAKIQVLKKGSFFSGRANKLYELYRNHGALEEIDEKMRGQLQERYFKRDFDQVYSDVKAYYTKEEIAVAESNPKQKMAYIFRWYFGYSSRLALHGEEKYKVDFQVHCGPALGAFNQWVKGTALESWQNRHVDEIAEKIMTGAAKVLNDRIEKFNR